MKISFVFYFYNKYIKYIPFPCKKIQNDCDDTAYHKNIFIVMPQMYTSDE